MFIFDKKKKSQNITKPIYYRSCHHRSNFLKSFTVFSFLHILIQRFKQDRKIYFVLIRMRIQLSAYWFVLMMILIVISSLHGMKFRPNTRNSMISRNFICKNRIQQLKFDPNSVFKFTCLEVSQGHQTWYHNRYVRYHFLLVCYSKFVPKMCRFQIFDVKKCYDLEIWVRGH